MHFTTLQFAVFFLVVLCLNWVLRERRGPYRFMLLAANMFFYASLSVRFLPLLILVGFLNWAFALAMSRTESSGWKKFCLAADVGLNLGILAFFKYFEFFYSALEAGLVHIGVRISFPLMEIVFPVGISFFTFQGLSYAVDVYRDRERLVKSPVDVLLFVSFFPTVLSGPIMRARNFIPQLDRPKFDQIDYHQGFALILSGLFKKVVIASYLSEHIVRQVFQVPDHFSAPAVLAGVYAYSIQIYCDFSGYTDLAMGIALLMGFSIPENFRSPYRALNVQEFWHRWHISLSTWLRDYLYISLGGNRKGEARKYINIMITMVLGGLWHGAHARFLLWGALHGLGLMVTHLYKDIRQKWRRASGENGEEGSGKSSVMGSFIAWLLTFHFVSFLWVFFRAENAERAFEIFQAVFQWSRPGEGFELLVIPAILAGLGIQFAGGHIERMYLWVQNRLPLPLQAVVISVIVLVILRMGPDGVLPFIYFQF
jgi:alginate O-acetyltransferase complex protein AlgI